MFLTNLLFCKKQFNFTQDRIYSVTNETPANVFSKDPNSANQTEEGAIYLEIKESFKKQVK